MPTGPALTVVQHVQTVSIGSMFLSYKCVAQTDVSSDGVSFGIHINVLACSGEITLVDMHVLGWGGVFGGSEAQHQSTFIYAVESQN